MYRYSKYPFSKYAFPNYYVSGTKLVIRVAKIKAIRVLKEVKTSRGD